MAEDGFPRVLPPMIVTKSKILKGDHCTDNDAGDGADSGDGVGKKNVVEGFHVPAQLASFVFGADKARLQRLRQRSNDSSNGAKKVAIASLSLPSSRGSSIIVKAVVGRCFEEEC